MPLAPVLRTVLAARTGARLPAARPVAIAALLGSLLMLPGNSAVAAEPEIKGLRLGMRLAAGEIEAIYEGPLRAEVEDSVGLTIPYDHIETRLADGSRLSLHFSPPSDGSRLFWIRHAVSWRWPVERTPPPLAELLADLEQRYGQPTRSAGPRDGSGSLLLVFDFGSGTGDAGSIDIPPGEIAGAQFLSYRQRVALLGRGFTGAMVTIVVDGEVAAMVEELVDHAAGATVLNPGP